MSRYADQSNPDTIKRWLKEGRGSGDGPTYKPWLQPADISSTGHSSRSPAWTSGRLYSLLSSNELNLFYALDASPLVMDIKEQFPLPLKTTQAIAASYGIKHPMDVKTKRVFTMTSDFLIILKTGRWQVRTVKPFAKLASPRVWAKFEIERLYWAAQNVDWGILTEREISLVVSENVQLVHDCYDLSGAPRLNPELARQIGDALLPDVLEQMTPIVALGCAMDKKLGLPLGDCMTAVKHLIATRVWLVDLRIPIDFSKTLSVTLKPSFSPSGDKT